MATIALSTKTITKMVTRTIGFTDTIVTMRGPVVTITDITTNHTITVMVTTLTLGFTSLPTEAEFTSGSAFDTALSVRIMVLQFFVFQAGDETQASEVMIFERNMRSFGSAFL